MKNVKKTLVLHRETIQTLEKASLQEAKGGFEQQQNLFMIISCFCSADCP
jgi:hypothetical protein